MATEWLHFGNGWLQEKIRPVTTHCHDRPSGIWGSRIRT
jgi:hypothetical protein